MHSILRKGLFIVMFSGLLLTVSITVKAEDERERLPGAGIQALLDKCESSQKEIRAEDYLSPEKRGEYRDMAFADVNSFLYIREKPEKESRWVGKLYPDDAATILGPVGEWTKVSSGDVTGFVYSKYIIIGSHAKEKAEKIVKEKKKDSPEKKPEELFAYAVARAQDEEDPDATSDSGDVSEIADTDQGIDEEGAEATEGTQECSGQAVVEYASQFIGNPYVWGGTSLTKGADCSGFVQAVYRHFGVNLPRTSKEQRAAGRAVSYEDVRKGDIICYDGHVGIYKGNGEIVNAINRSRGIGILSATYTNIVTVRRIF